LGGDDDVGGGQGVEAADDLVAGGLRQAEGGNQRRDAEDGAQRGEHRPAGPGREAGQRLPEEVAAVEVGLQRRHGRALPAVAVLSGGTPDPGEISPSWPSTMRTRRSARSATCSSWVITTRVSPSRDSCPR